MTLIIEDGTIVPNSNSYINDTYLVSYASDRGITISQDEAERCLIKAMDYLESLSFIGTKLTKEQSLQWPRQGVTIDGFLVDYNEIPKELKKAQAETALAVSRGEDPLADIPKNIESASVGSISVTYSSGSTSTILKSVQYSLSKLLQSGGMGSSGIFKVDRG